LTTARKLNNGSNVYRGWKNKSDTYWHNNLIERQYDILLNQGGTGSGKTIGITQNIFDLLVMNPGWRATVAGQDLPNLKRGAVNDFQIALRDDPDMRLLIKNPDAKEPIYRLFNDSILEYVAYQNFQDAKAGRREILYVNEANGVQWEIFYELEQRTKFRTFIDYNPTAPFWAHTEIKPLRRTKFIRTNFRDNKYCPEKTVRDMRNLYLKYKESGSVYWENKWRVYGLGLTGIIEGAVFPTVRPVGQFPDRSELKAFSYGIDFGYVNDPLAIGMNGIRRDNGRYVGKELLYETGLSAYSLPEIFPVLGIKKSDPIVADSANMDAIDYLCGKGWNVFPADKSPGSVKSGIELLNACGIDIVQGSLNWFMEAGNYLYRRTEGRYDKNLPIDKDNHLWDQARYFIRWAMLNKGIKNTVPVTPASFDRFAPTREFFRIR
jgi:phage terminase large subunit